jgi:hypothetical protein
MKSEMFASCLENDTHTKKKRQHLISNTFLRVVVDVPLKANISDFINYLSFYYNLGTAGKSLQNSH